MSLCFQTSKILTVCKIRLEVLARLKAWQDLGLGKIKGLAKSWSWHHQGLGKMEVVTSLSMQAITEVQLTLFYLYCMHRAFCVNSTLNSHSILVVYQIHSTVSSHIPTTRLATLVSPQKIFVLSIE